MKRALLIIPVLILSMFALGQQTVRACEPCSKELSKGFEATARAADLIVIARRDDFTPDELKNGTFGPEMIKLNIVQVLKGTESRAAISAKSWSGMCPYGIIINDNLEHVIFLKKSGETYRAVDDCSVKSYKVKDGVVEFEKQKISIEDFRQKLEQLGQQASGNPAGSSLFSNLYRMIVGG